MNIYWKSYNPLQEPRTTQYKSILFYHDNVQKLKIEKFIYSKEESETVSVSPEIRQYQYFYQAEAYHQKYYIRQFPRLMEFLKKIYADDIQFITSTLAARLNGFIGGNCNIVELESEIIKCGLQETEKNNLLKIINAAGISV